MATASSPALSSNTNEASVTTTSSAAIPAINASRNLRGLNKPKCIKCGNVARSRCPYQSCKSCCSKAQNPCHIHVLKGNSTFPESIPSSNSHVFDQQAALASASGNSLRIASFRQLSNNFSQFNNLQSPLRSRKPMTKKDAAVINEWRFSKLKEYRDRNIEAENEAFDHYMQNVSLLEEVFSVNSTMDGHMEDEDAAQSSPSSVEDGTERMIGGLKLKLRSNPIRTASFRRRMQYIISQGLMKFKSSGDGVGDHIEQDEVMRKEKKHKSWMAERTSVLSDLIDRLSKARNEEDLKACMEMKTQIFNKNINTTQLDSEEQNVENDITHRQQSIYSPPKWFSTTSTNQETLIQIDAHFSSLEEIEDL